MILIAVAAALIVGGTVTWWLLGRSVQTTIPESFDGEWKSQNANGPVLRASFDGGLQKGTLASGANGCYNGVLAVSEATNSRLRMRFTPTDPTKCNTWTAVFTHLDGGDLSMAVNSDSNIGHETDFETRMIRQG